MFVISDNGPVDCRASLSVGVCAVCAKQAEIGIILDHSTSIVTEAGGGQNNWDVAVKGFLTQLIDAFPIGPSLTRMGMVGFSSSAWLQFGFSAYNNARTMTAAVREMEIRGGETNIAQVCTMQQETHRVCINEGLQRAVSRN